MPSPRLASPRLRSRIPPRLLLAVAVSYLCGCMIKDKHEKASDAGPPPWDRFVFAPRTLAPPPAPDTTGAFAVFDPIDRIDSLAGDSRNWMASKDAVDTLRVGVLFDTGFVFPAEPEAARPYAYDESYRDDTLWRNAYGNGLFVQEHPCARITVLTGAFPHPARWLKAGLTQSEITSALGEPAYRQPGALRYLSRHPGPEPRRDPEDDRSTAAYYAAYDVYEGINLYFSGDSLFAAVLLKSHPCR